jgi:hypothetical protein
MNSSATAERSQRFAASCWKRACQYCLMMRGLALNGGFTSLMSASFASPSPIGSPFLDTHLLDLP